MVTLSAFELAQRFVGIKEVPGSDHNPHIMAMLTLDQSWPTADEVPWCSAFVNYIAWLLRLPRSKNLQAQSWLGVGIPVDINEARAGFDVVILSRGTNVPVAPGLLPPGHVGFFASYNAGQVHVLGGNQSNQVNVSPYSVGRLLGVRRLL